MPHGRPSPPRCDRVASRSRDRIAGRDFEESSLDALVPRCVGSLGLKTEPVLCCKGGGDDDAMRGVRDDECPPEARGRSGGGAALHDCPGGAAARGAEMGSKRCGWIGVKVGGFMIACES